MADSGEQQLYREAQRHLKNENFGLAVRSLQMLESRYPFGRYAEQAQLELIYAHYGAFEFAAATESADRFIRLHPRHPNVDYAFYMKGLAAYDIEPGFFRDSFPQTIPNEISATFRSPLANFLSYCLATPTAPMHLMRVNA